MAVRSPGTGLVAGGPPLRGAHSRRGTLETGVPEPAARDRLQGNMVAGRRWRAEVPEQGSHCRSKSPCRSRLNCKK